MIKLFLILAFSLPLFSSSLSLYDLGFLVSKSTGKSVIYSDKVDKTVKIIISKKPLDYLPLFKQSLKSNGYALVSEKTFFYVTVPVEKSKDSGVFGSLSSFGSSPSSDTLMPPPPLTSTGSGISVTSNGQPIYSNSMFSSPGQLNDSNRSITSLDLDENITFKSLSLTYLKASDLNDSLNFSGFRYSVASNSKSVIFAVPHKKTVLFNNFIDSIKALDIPHEQVTLKITVFDSDSKKLRDLGFSPVFNLDTGVGSASGSLLTGTFVSSFYASLHALENKGVTSVKDSPTFLLSNNETLDFKSVLNVPFLDENINVTNQNATNQSSRFIYKPIGFKVLVTPNIVNDTVYLDFSISFENVVSGGDRPTTSEKSIKNKFSLHKGDLIVLAGISKNTIKDSRDSLPFLKSFPFVENFLSRDQTSSNDESFNISIEVIK